LRNEAVIHLVHVVNDVLSHKSIEQGRLLVLRESTVPSGPTIDALSRLLVEERMGMAYQPIVGASDRQIFAYEALCRPEDDQISDPHGLFDAAARTGALWALGRLVRGKIAGEIRRFPLDTLLFVNLHPAELEDLELLEGEPRLLSF